MYVMIFRSLAWVLVSVSVLISGCGGGGGGGSKKPPDSGDVSVDSELIYQPGSPASYATVGVAKSAVSSAEETTIILDDGTLARVPALEGPYEARLERTSTSEVFANTILADTGVILSGSTRRLSIKGSGNILTLIPEVTIPRTEAGSINIETISVIRRGPAMVDGEYIDDHIMALPVRVDDDGNFRVVDPMINEGLVAFIDTASEGDEIPEGSGNVTLSTRSGKAAAWELRSEYVLMSFENDLNWNRKPHLVRMVVQPDDASSGFRRPATSQEMAEMSRTPLCNLVLLVHGHNEQEKGGSSVETSEVAPWLFSYKRLVWDLFYQNISSSTGSSDQQPVYPLDCTAFYEFIYPTYRPIFSPVGIKTGVHHETLGEAFGKAVSQEISANPQLGAMLKNNTPFNVMIVAHSQGGVVARAGLRHMPEALRERTVRLVTWGSPHQGAALYTLRYALQSGHDMFIDGWRIPLQSVASSKYLGDRYRDALNVLAIDAPGIRDIRWSKAWDHKTRVWELFPGLGGVFFDVQVPVPLFSENLTVFNADTQDETISGGYTFITGQTSKSADFEFNSVSETWNFVKNLTGIQKGATLNRLMMASDYDRVSDGAVPIFSQSAGNIVFDHPVRVRDLGDMDHEEFYGSEHEQRTAETITKGNLTAGVTLEELGMLAPSRHCPTLSATRVVDGDSTKVLGAIDYALFSDQKLLSFKDQVTRIEIREGDQDGRVIRGGSFSVADDGAFEVSLKSADMPERAVAVAVLKDNSEISGKVTGTEVTILPPRIITYEVASGVDEVEESFEAGATPEGVYRYVWQFPGGVSATQVRGSGELSAVSHVFRDYEFDVPVEVRVLLYDAENSLLATDSISVTFVEKEPAPLFEYDCGWDVDYSSLTFLTWRDGYNLGNFLDTVLFFASGYVNSAGMYHGPGVSFYDRDQTRPDWAMCFRDHRSYGYVTGWYDDDERTPWYEVWYDGNGYRQGFEYRYFKSGNWCNRTEYSQGAAIAEDGFFGQCPWRSANGGLTLTGVDPGS